MKILDLLDKEAIITDLKATNKMGVIEELITPISQITQTDKTELIRVIMSRERLGSTGIGDGVGIPHGKLKNLPALVLGFGLSRKGVDFESIDGKRTYIFFLLLTPEDAAGLHLKLLARISRLLKNDLFRQQLIDAQNSDEVYAVIQSSDEDF
ncbi:MAG: PTS sugar transporter subunit IIA [Deltaproteobacteria bacterium]|nr:MAG: PTS sugar transporter subunit IIA [Deltaproteobacteria bacterium]